MKGLPLSFGDEQKVKVILNPDVLTSDAFFAEFEKMFVSPQLPAGLKNPFEISGEEKTKAQQVIREILEKNNPQILLRIGREDGILHSCDFSMNLNLADLGIAELSAGRVKITINSNLAEINQPQQIEIPENAEEIDLLSFIPVPPDEEVEAETAVETEAFGETEAEEAGVEENLE